MSTNFPASLDALTNPVASDPVTSPSHAGQHTNANDSIEALEAKVGVDSSAVTTSLDYKIKSTSSLDPGHKHTPTVSLAITGTPTGSKFLRDDDTWAIPSNGDIVGPSSSVDSEIVLFDSTTGKLAKRATNTGMLRATSGVIATATAGTDYASPKFGGDGSDGALNTTSGTVNINLSNAKYVIKNYTSITIATNNLTFTNPHTTGTVIILKSTGAVTISATINAAGHGGAGGASKVSSTGSDVAGDTGSNGIGYIWANNAGVGGQTNAVGTGGAVATTSYVHPTAGAYKYPFLLVGSGGGSGSIESSASGGTGEVSGSGGNGGCAFIIECGGALSFSGSINNDGGAGGNAVASGSALRNCAGGGGGSGGFTLVIANTISVNSGTLSNVGGVGGDADSDGYASAPFGGGGGGFGDTAGSNGTSATSGKTGGNGAAGYGLVTLNKDFV